MGPYVLGNEVALPWSDKLGPSQICEPGRTESQIPERRTGGFATGVAADHAVALFPMALALDLVSGCAVLGHAAGHACPLWPPKNSQSGRPAARFQG